MRAHAGSHTVLVPTPVEPRRVAGRYRLDAVLGRGARGTVWAAHDEVLGRPVAVKEVLFPPGIPEAEADALRERTLREARAIAVLSHPNVVTLYDVAREGRDPLVVMELVPSRSLAEVLRDEGRLPYRTAATVGTAVAAALAAAHAAGITHRDVKPGNVLVAHDGRVKLTDFGIARNPADVTITAAGLMLGSPSFIAPEVASGKPVTTAADLWGLGATLFAAVEGRPPYDVDGDPMATVAAVVQDDVPAPTVGGPLGAVIRGLLVKDPTARMPLAQVHRTLRPLTDARTRAPFPTGGAPPVARRVAPPAARPVTPPAVPPVSGSGALLASNPGPLPWATGAAALPPRRSTARVAALYGLALLLVAVSAAGTFAATRSAAGLAVLPSAAPAAAEIAAPTPPVPIGEREVTMAGSDEVEFTIAVPLGWLEFRERRTLAGAPSEVVRFVSPDGASVITVARVGGSEDAPLTGVLGSHLAGVAAGVTRLVEVGRDTVDDGVELTYRTVEGVGDGAMLRTSFLRVLPGPWLVLVTVPTEREEAGRMDLFDRVLPTFTPS